MSRQWIIWFVVFVSALMFFLSSDDDLLDEYGPSLIGPSSISEAQLSHIESLADPATREYFEQAGATASATTAIAASIPGLDAELQIWEPNLENVEQHCTEQLDINPENDDLHLIRAAVYVDTERYQAALDAIDSTIARDSQRWQAHALHGLTLSRMDRLDEANVAFAQAWVWAEAMPDDWNSTYPNEDFDEAPDMPGPRILDKLVQCDDLEDRASLSGMLFGVLFVIAFLTGRRQRHEGGGTWRELFCVSLFVAALWTMPYVAWALLLTIESIARPDAWGALTFFPVAAFLTWGVMLRPTISYRGREALPVSEDADLQAAVERIAGELKLSPPRVRVQQALSALSDASPAFAGGLAPPSIVVYDTFSLMLDKHEREAILAHEFGHIVNHTIWWFTLVRVLGLAVTFLVMTFSSVGVAMMGGLLFILGTGRFVSRLCEYDCDRRAARVTDAATMRRALRRIHVGHPFGHGLASRLVYATATHPSLAQRIAALCRLDPDCDYSAEYDAGEVQTDDRRATLAFVVWAVLFPGLLFASTIPALAESAFWFLFGLFLLPTVFIYVASSRVRRVEKRRNQNGLGWKRSPLIRKAGLVLQWLGCAMFGSNLLISVVHPDVSDPWVFTLGGGGIVALICSGLAFIRSASRGKRDHKVEQKVIAALQRGDYAEVINLTEDKPKISGRGGHFLTRYNLAVSYMATGEIGQAEAKLDALLEECPGFGMPAVLLAVLRLEKRQPEEALEFVLKARDELHPDDWMSFQLASRCLRRLGRIDEAKEQSREAFERGPEQAAVVAQQAMLALDSGDTAESDRLLAVADALLPADPILRLSRAGRAISLREFDRAQSELNGLRGYLADQPLVQLHSEIERLEAVIARQPPPVEHDL